MTILFYCEISQSAIGGHPYRNVSLRLAHRDNKSAAIRRIRKIRAVFELMCAVGAGSDHNADFSDAADGR